jgi:hypothetical protein
VVGGALFALLGLAAASVSVAGFLRDTNSLGTTVMMLLTLALPPLLSGVLFLIDAHRGGTESREITPNG